MSELDSSLLFAFFLGLALASGVFWFLIQRQQSRKFDKFIDQINQSKEDNKREEVSTARMQDELRNLSTLVTQSGAKMATSEDMHSFKEKTSQNIHSLNIDTLKKLKTLGEELTEVTNMKGGLSTLSQKMQSFLDLVQGSSQKRGQFGEMQLETLVGQILPNTAYSFRRKLSSGVVPDCFISLPNPPGNIMIDSKFPLAVFRELMNDPDKDSLIKKFNKDTENLIEDVSSKYIVPGETADFALIFFPSDKIYQELQRKRHQSVRDKAYASKVFMVSPSTIAPVLGLLQVVLRDVQLQERNKDLIVQLGFIYEFAGLLHKDLEGAKKSIRIAGDKMVNLEKHTGKITASVDKLKGMEAGVISAGEETRESTHSSVTLQ